MKNLLKAFCALPQHSQSSTICYSGYRRPIPQYACLDSVFCNDVGNLNKPTDATFFLHRVLYNIYEQDMVFLPAEENASIYNEFLIFYSEEAVALGQQLRTKIEHVLFNKFENQHYASGGWTLEHLRNYLLEEKHRITTEKSTRVFDAIKESINPRRAFRTLLVQGSGDLLSEASGCLRYLGGAYGELQSELFIIQIDEYGYGVHNKKHSTLFENMLIKNHLSSNVHFYWPYYFNSTLALHNYIHYLCGNQRNFFKQLGALFFAETAYAQSSRVMSSGLKEIFGDFEYTEYYDEHAEIDKDHSKMALERIIIPAILKFGNEVALDVISGFEGFKSILDYCADEFISAVKEIDNLDKAGAIIENDKSKNSNRINPVQIFKQNSLKNEGEFRIEIGPGLQVNSGFIELIQDGTYLSLSN